MNWLEEKKISVKSYSVSNYKEEKTDKEVIEITGFKENDIPEMEKKGFFFIPCKITYARKTASFDELMKELTKNKRNKIKKARRNNFEIIKEKKVTKDNYVEWHKSVYLPGIDKKSVGIPYAPGDWYEKDTNCRKICVYAKDKGKIIAGIVAKEFSKSDQFPERMSISYSAVNEEYKHSGVNELLNCLMIDLAKEEGYEWIFRGMDTNLYGKHLSAGIPIFKTSLNFKILQRKQKNLVNALIKLNNLDEFGDVIFFVSHGKEKLVGNLVLKKEIKNEKEYDFEFLEKLRVFEWKDEELILSNK